MRQKVSVKLNVSPIQILSKLIPRNVNEIELLPATIEQINGIIKRAKPKNSTSSDIISMRVIKKYHLPLIPTLHI